MIIGRGPMNGNQYLEPALEIEFGFIQVLRLSDEKYKQMKYLIYR